MNKLLEEKLTKNSRLQYELKARKQCYEISEISLKEEKETLEERILQIIKEENNLKILKIDYSCKEFALKKNDLLFNKLLEKKNEKYVILYD